LDLFFVSAERTKKNGRVLFLCQAGPRVGLGHLRRCLAVASELGPSVNQVVFQVRTTAESQVEQVMDQAGFSLRRGLGRADFELVCLDLKEPDQGLIAWADHPGLIVIHDQPLACDCRLFVWPELGADLEWLAEKGIGPEKAAAGPEYVIVRPEIARLRPKPDKEPLVVVALGGGDPGPGLADLVRALDLVPARFNLKIALGGEYEAVHHLERIAPGMTHPLQWAVLSPDLPDWLARASLAVHGTGTTAYEVFCLGLGGVSVIMAPDQLGEARWMEALGLGLAAELDQAQEIAGEVASLLSHPGQARELGERRRALVDGRGAGRVAARMLDLLS